MYLVSLALHTRLRRKKEDIGRLDLQSVKIDSIAMNNRSWFLLLFRPSAACQRGYRKRTYFVINCATFQIWGRRLANFHSSSLVIPSPRSLASHWSSLLIYLLLYYWGICTLPCEKVCRECWPLKKWHVKHSDCCLCFHEQGLLWHQHSADPWMVSSNLSAQPSQPM